jgi:hypothetical protein
MKYFLLEIGLSILNLSPFLEKVKAKDRFEWEEKRKNLTNK